MFVSMRSKTLRCGIIDSEELERIAADTMKLGRGTGAMVGLHSLPGVSLVTCTIPAVIRTIPAGRQSIGAVDHTSC
jgi:hypothetical protein